MRPRDEGRGFSGTSNGYSNIEQRQKEPMSSHATNTRASPPRPLRVYESYRPARPDPPLHSRTHYQTHRPERPVTPTRLRDTFRRESREEHVRFEDRHTFQDRQYNGRDAEPFHRNADRLDDHARKFSSAAPRYDEARPEHQYSLFPGLTSHVLPRPPPQSAHFRDRTWPRPASVARQPLPARLTVPAAESRPAFNGVDDLTRHPLPKGIPPVEQSVKQSPHVFIPAKCLPVKHSTIQNLEDLRAKVVPTKPGSFHVFMDDTGYFVTFPGDKQGLYHQAMWLKTNERTVLFGMYHLDSMVSFPSGQTGNVAHTGSFNPGRLNAASVAMKEFESNEDQLIAGFDADDVNSSVRGAAVASDGSRDPVTLQGAGKGEFMIRGAASTSPPGPTARPPTAEVSCTVEKLQVRRTNLLVSSQVAGTDVFSNNVPASPVSIPRVDRDDAASSVSGATESDVSASKAPKCHVCKSRTSSLVKCSTCNRHYHRYCHAHPPISQISSCEWQCRRCQLKGVPPRRSNPQNLSAAMEQNTQEKQRFPIPETAGSNRTDGDTSLAVADPASIAEAAFVGDFQQETATNATFTNASHDQLDFLDDDGEAHYLVAGSFSVSSIGAPQKKGGRLKAVKRKISMTGAESGNWARTVSAVDEDPARVTTASTYEPQLRNGASHMVAQETGKAQTPELRHGNAAVSRVIHDSASPITKSRPAGGKNAKKTQDSRKRKCTACNVRSVPFNPYGRTICQTCKDAGVKFHPPLEPTVKDTQAVKAPHQPILEQDSPDDQPEPMLDVQPNVMKTARVEDVANDGSADPVLVEIGTPAATADSVPAFHPMATVDVNIPDYLTGVEGTAADPEAGIPKPQQVQEQGPDVSPLSDNNSTDGTDVNDDEVLSVSHAKRALNRKLVNKGIQPAKKRRTRSNHMTIAKDQYDLGDSFERPPNTYRRLVHLAISDAPNGQLRAKQIVQWIDTNVPNYSLGLGKWAPGIVSTLNFASNTSGKNGVPTLRRHGPGGGEDWYEILPEWKDKVDRWDAALSRPISALARDRGVSVGKAREALPPEGIIEKSSSVSVSEAPSTGLLKSIAAAKNSRQKRPAGEIPLDELMDIDSNIVDDSSSSTEEPLARVRANTHATSQDMTMDDSFATESAHSVTDRIPVADSEATDVLSAEITPVMEEGNMVRMSRHAIAGIPNVPFSVHGITLEQVLACRPPAVHTELHKAWPSLDCSKTEFEYEAKMAEIRARPGRKARLGQKRPVDAEKALAVAGPSKVPSWPPIDNSLGLTQEHFGDELSLQPCKTWDEFFGTTEEVKPCVVDGKLAYRPVWEKSRTVYKTSI